jgi:hypothetical protein
MPFWLDQFSCAGFSKFSSFEGFVHPRLPWPFCWKLRHFINANANPVAKDQLADPAATADASASASPDASDDPACSADPIEKNNNLYVI